MSLYGAIKKLVIKNGHVNWAIADQSIVSGSNLLTGILLARILGISGFGHFTLAWMVVLFTVMLQQTVIVSPMMSIAPKQSSEDKAGYFGSVFIQLLVFISICSIVTFFGVIIEDSVSHKWDMPGLALPLAVTVFLNLFQDFLRRYFYTIGKPKLSFISDFFSYISQIIVLLFICFSEEYTLNVVMALWVIAATTLLGIVVVLKNIVFLPFSIGKNKAHFLRNWHFSKWLTASAMVQWFTSNIFMIVAGSTIGAAPVGAFKAGQTLLGVTHIMFLALENIIPLKAAELLAKNNIKGMLDYLLKTGAVGLLFVISVVLVFAIVPEFWIRNLYGEEFVPYSYLVHWIAGFYILLAISLPIRYGLKALEETKIFFYTQIFVSILSIISVNIVIEKFGISGVAMSSVVTQIIVITLGLIWLRRAIKRYKS